jgi:predicted Holliday junction resolvase-like endonuclease
MNTKTILILVATAIFSFILGKLIQKLKDNKLIKKERADAVKRSRAVIGGQFTEQIAPFLPAFPCNAGDARFIGKPVDFIAFPGSAEGKAIEEILLIEVKTGDSRLSEKEKQIKTAVENGNVKYVVYRI